MIELDAVSKRYAGATEPAVDALNIVFRPNELTVLVGPSGCGKTTTLKMINRIIEPSSGSIRIDGTDILDVPAHELRRGIGYVIQRIGLFPHRTVAQNIATVPMMLGWDRDRIRARTEELISLMDLEHDLLRRYPSQLSGGQQQRVGVARALAADPPILLMDEPFGAVDPVVRDRLQQQLLELQAKLNKTIVLVTHDIDEAILLGDRIAIFETGGRVAQFDTPRAILSHPETPFVTRFLGAEHNLKRLATIPVGEAELVSGPTAEIDASYEAMRAICAQEQTDWLALTRNGQLEGWVWLHDLSPSEPVSPTVVHDFRVVVSPAQTLRSALDAIVATRNQVAIVVEDGTLIGMLFIEHVSRQLLP